MELRRRDFLLGGAAAGAVVGAGVIVPLGFVLADGDSTNATGARFAEFPRASIANLSDLEVGVPQFFNYPFEGLSNVLVRMGEPVLGGTGADRDIVAYSNVCTHMGCPITTYQAETHVLGPCPCHFSTFDLSRDGIVSFGQATQNLARVLLEIDGDDIGAVGVYRLVYGLGDNLSGENLVAVAEDLT